jgi:formylmethanofuran dehydrogenase subunit C
LIELKLHPEQPGEFDGASLHAESLIGKLPLEIANLTIDTPEGRMPLGALFSISTREEHPETVVLRGDFSRVEQLGRDHRSGTLIVDGTVGNRFGASQSGGRILVLGDAGDFAFEGRSGGEALIAGDVLAAPSPGAKSGMRGGDLIVLGAVGKRACERMRRGSVAIGGSAGDGMAANMIAGTVFVAGTLGSDWGTGMKRGSLIVLNPVEESAACMSEAREFELSFLPLLWNHCRGLQSRLHHVCMEVCGRAWPLLEFPTTRWALRQVGDLHVDGKAELLVLTRITRGVVRGVSSPLFHS